MILKGSQRAGAKQLANHLLNDRDNDHVTTLELRGFVASDLRGALSECHAISKATKCRQFMFSLSLNPPKHHSAAEADFLAAADKAEKSLGLEGQPRAVIIHEKEGRRHAHVVWSRIDTQTLKAVNLPFFKERLKKLSKELFLDHGWSLPDGLKANGGKSPLNFTRAEWQQAQRQKIDPREIKDIFRDAWERSETLKGFGNAMAERGFFIAKGDRRGFVAVDVQGEVYSLPRWIGVRTKEVNAKFGKPDQLEPVSAVKAAVQARVTAQLLAFIKEVKDKQARDLKPLADEKARLVAKQRREREDLAKKQDARWQTETKARAERFRKGLKGIFDVVTGRAREIRKQNEAEAYRCLKRDEAQRDDLAQAQLAERQSLQLKFDELRITHRRERKLLARDVTQFLRSSERRSEGVSRSRKDPEHEADRPKQPENRPRGHRFSL